MMEIFYYAAKRSNKARFAMTAQNKRVHIACGIR